MKKFSAEVTIILEAYFRQIEFPKPSDIRILAEMCKLTPIQVKTWFRNKKCREMRKVEKLNQSEDSLDFDRRAKRCIARIAMLKKWLDIARYLINDSSSDSSSINLTETEAVSNSDTDDCLTTSAATHGSNSPSLDDNDNDDDDEVSTITAQAAYCIKFSVKQAHGQGISSTSSSSSSPSSKITVSPIVISKTKTTLQNANGNQRSQMKSNGKVAQGSTSLPDDDKPSTSAAARALNRDLYSDEVVNRFSSYSTSSSRM